MKKEEIAPWNEKQLLLIDESNDTGNVRTKVNKIITQLSVYYPSIIHRDVFRSPKEQEQKFKDGNSSVKWGFHCFTRNGQPASLAADIVSSDHNYWDDKKFIAENTDEIYWLLLGSFAREFGLYWGGYFGLNPVEEKELNAIFDTNKFELIEEYANQVISKQKRIGWDPAHVQTKLLSIDQAYKIKS